MVLLVEQERLLADELPLVNDPTQRSQSITADWTNITTKNVTLPKQLLLFIKATFANGGTSPRAAGRVTVDGTPVFTTGGWQGGGWSTNMKTTPDLYVRLSAGAHVIGFQGAAWSGTNPWVGVKDIVIGQLNFNDFISGVFDGGTVTVSAGSTVNLLNQNVAVPVGRVIPVGTVKSYGLFILAVAYDDHASAPTRKTRMKNSGEANDSGKINVTLFVNDAQVNWSVYRANDDADGDGSNPAFGMGSFGYYAGSVSADQALNVKVKAYASILQYGRCVVQVLLCPWLVPFSELQPANLSFPQGSTFYAKVEPLAENSAVKYSKIGKARFVSFGDSTDFYSSVSGTGILDHAFTFDVVDAASSFWMVSATTIVCVSYVGVDVR